MADDIKNKDEEPSIEEILSSIRDIISDEDEDTPNAENPESTEDSDVLDLTDIVEEEESDQAQAMAGDDIDALFGGDDANKDDGADDPLAGINFDHPGDDLDVIDIAGEDVREEDNIADGVEEILSADFDAETDQEDVTESVTDDTAVEIEDAPEPVSNDREDMEQGLLDKAAAVATVSSMARLAENIAISRTSVGTTLEDVVRDLLRPMLKDWLDENLPELIERLVKEELERLAEKAARK